VFPRTTADDDRVTYLCPSCTSFTSATEQPKKKAGGKKGGKKKGGAKKGGLKKNKVAPAPAADKPYQKDEDVWEHHNMSAFLKVRPSKCQWPLACTLT